jgi:hypothetical protein
LLNIGFIGYKKGMESTTKESRRKRRLLWPWTLFFVVLLIIAALTIHKTYWQNQVQNRLDALRAAGHPVSSEDLDALYVMPPPGENAADVYQEAFAQLVDWKSQPDKLGLLPIAGNAEFQQFNELFTSETMDLIGEYLSDNAQARQLLHQAVSLEACRYPVDFSQGFSMLIPHLGKYRFCEMLLQLEVIHHLYHKDTDKAIQSAHAIFCLARSLKKEPILISQLIRVAVSAEFVNTVELILNHSTPSSAQIRQLREMLDEVYDPNWLRQAFISERALGCEELNDPAMFENHKTPKFMFSLYAAIGFDDRARLNYLDMMEELLPTLRLPPPKRFHVIEVINQRIEHKSGIRGAFLITIPALCRTVIIDVRHQGQQLLALTALTIENYRRDHQQLPASLADLVPDYLDELPVDPYDGKPIRYEKRTKGYCLYCIGEDLTDNHGVRFDIEGHQYTAGTDVTFIVER